MSGRAAPQREVLRVHELDGPRGGVVLVHMLECGDWVALRRRRAAKRLACVACWLREHGEVTPPE